MLLSYGAGKFTYWPFFIHLDFLKSSIDFSIIVPCVFYNVTIDFEYNFKSQGNSD